MKTVEISTFSFKLEWIYIHMYCWFIKVYCVQHDDGCVFWIAVALYTWFISRNDFCKKDIYFTIHHFHIIILVHEYELIIIPSLKMYKTIIQKQTHSSYSYNKKRKDGKVEYQRSNVKKTGNHYYCLRTKSAWKEKQATLVIQWILLYDPLQSYGRLRILILTHLHAHQYDRICEYKW